MNYIPFDPSISQKILIVIKYVIEGFYFIMNPLILYDLLLLPLSHFIRTWSGAERGEKWNFIFYFTNGHARSYIYIRIDRSTGGFAPEIFLQIVGVSTPIAMFYSEE